MTNNLIGARIKALREERGLSQDQLARAMGFNDRQILSNIETGVRRVSADELLRAAEILDAPLDFFSDPFLLAGEGKFSWRRQNDVGSERLCAYERVAGRWIAAFRVIAPQVKKPAPLLRRSLGLTKQHSYEDAMAAGERFAAEFKLGDAPALRLAETLEQQLGILVLMVDALDGVSGAACRLPELDVVLVNRHEVAGRRHFDLAHELFHILTWDTMPPEHAEDSVEYGGSRVEQLANNFASALLMPARILERFGDWAALRGGGLVAQMKSAAEVLQVTASALKWRLVALGKLALSVAKALSDADLRGKTPPKSALPPLFSKKFMEVIALGLDTGRLSVRRAAGLLDLSVDDLVDLFRIHNVHAPVDV